MTMQKPAIFIDKDRIHVALKRTLMAHLCLSAEAVFKHAETIQGADIILSSVEGASINEKPVYSLKKDEPIALTALIADILNLLQAWRHEHKRFLMVSDALRVDLQTKILSIDKECQVHLTEKETQIIEALYHAPDHALTRNDLLEKVWYIDRQDIETHTVETHIYRLRQKLIKADTRLDDFIQTTDNDVTSFYALNIDLV